MNLNRRYRGDPFVVVVAIRHDGKSHFTRHPSLGREHALHFNIPDNVDWKVEGSDVSKREAKALHRAITSTALVYVFIHKADADFVRAISEFILALVELRSGRGIHVLVAPHVFAGDKIDSLRRMLSTTGVDVSEYSRTSMNQLSEATERRSARRWTLSQFAQFGKKVGEVLTSLIM